MRDEEVARGLLLLEALRREIKVPIMPQWRVLLVTTMSEAVVAQRMETILGNPEER